MGRSWQVRGNSTATVVVLATTGGTFAVLQSIVGPALPVMQQQLGADQLTVTWVMTAYLLSASVMTPVLGRLGDSFGKRRVLLLTLGLIIAGTAVSAMAENIAVMIVGRLIQGAGGGVFPLAFGILRDHFDGWRLHRAVGTVAGISAGCAGLGGVMSGIVVELGGFRWLFWAPMIVTALCLLIVCALPPSPRSPSPLSARSVALFSLWLSSLLLIVSQGRSWGLATWPVPVLIVVASSAFLVWVGVERKTQGPLIDLTLMRSNVMWTTSASAAMLGVILYGMQTFLPQFVQRSAADGAGLGLSVMESGLVLAPMAAGIFVFGFTASSIVRRFGVRSTLVAGPVVAATGLAFLIFSPPTLWQVLVATTLTGIGIGLPLAAMPALILTSVPPHQTGVAGGINANLRTVGGAIGAALVASAVATGPVPTGNYQAGFAIVAGAALLAVLIGLFVQISPRGPGKATA